MKINKAIILRKYTNFRDISHIPTGSDIVLEMKDGKVYYGKIYDRQTPQYGYSDFKKYPHLSIRFKPGTSNVRTTPGPYRSVKIVESSYKGTEVLFKALYVIKKPYRDKMFNIKVIPKPKTSVTKRKMPLKKTAVKKKTPVKRRTVTRRKT